MGIPLKRTQWSTGANRASRMLPLTSPPNMGQLKAEYWSCQRKPIMHLDPSLSTTTIRCTAAASPLAGYANKPSAEPASSSKSSLALLTDLGFTFNYKQTPPEQLDEFIGLGWGTLACTFGCQQPKHAN
jgi:hypothetical protein